MGSIRGSVVVIASLTLVGGCGLGPPGGDNQGGDEGPETVTVTSSSSSTPTQETRTETATATETADASSTSSTSATPGLATTSPVAGGAALPTDVRGYADAFVRAWGVGDRQDASRYATSTTVSSLFGLDARGGSSWSRDGEVDQGGRTQVRYTDGNDMVLYVLVDRATAKAGGGDAVVGASLEYEGSIDEDHDPGEESAGVSDITVPETTTSTYCDALVRAWGAGRRATADKYATSTAMTQLFDDHGTGGSGWSQTSVTRYYALYTNTDGTKLTLYFNSVSVAGGWGDGVYYAEFT